MTSPAVPFAVPFAAPFAALAESVQPPPERHDDQAGATGRGSEVVYAVSVLAAGVLLLFTTF